MTTLEFLDRYLRIPSVAAHGTGIRESVKLLVETFEAMGCATRVLETPRNPVVVAEKKTPASSKRLLIYNHYDVQPPDPLDEWLSPPFEPTIRDGRLFARGVADNKANLAVRIAAVRALGDRLPVNVTFMVEGEEEIGSPSLAGFVTAHRDLLAADACLWETGGRDERGAPDVICGVKGILHAEVVCHGPARDLHSSLGVAVPSPAWRLVHALAGLRAPDGTVTLPGFYEHMKRPDAVDRAVLRAMPYDEDARKKNYGIDAFLAGLGGEDLKEALIFRPTININGITTGYQGMGSKTILPKCASAKFDVRLVPDMHPDDILAKLKAWFEPLGMEVVDAHGYPPARTPVDAPVVAAAIAAGRTAWGVEPFVQPMMAPSGPMSVIRALMPCVSFGTGNPMSNIHAPNESVVVEDLAKGERHVHEFLGEFARR